MALVVVVVVVSISIHSWGRCLWSFFCSFWGMHFLFSFLTFLTQSDVVEYQSGVVAGSQTNFKLISNP